MHIVKNQTKANQPQPAPVIWRMKQIRAATGLPSSTVYDHIGKGLFTKPIKLGERMSGWLESEVTAIIGARIAGKPEGDIRALVADLEKARVANWG